MALDAGTAVVASAGSSAAGSSSGQPADEAPASTWVRVPDQPETFVFSVSTEAMPPPGLRLFSMDLNWLAGLRAGGKVRFDCVPGRTDGCEWPLGMDTTGPVKLTCSVDAAAVKTPTFTVSNLLTERERAPSPAPTEVVNEPPVIDGRRERVPSIFRPAKPVAEVEARLATLGWRPGSAQGKGDCCPLSVCAGHEVTIQQAATPSTETTGACTHAVPCIPPLSHAEALIPPRRGHTCDAQPRRLPHLWDRAHRWHLR